MNSETHDWNRELVESLLEALRQGETLLSGIDDDIYTRKLTAAFNATIGGHYRHCLDHFRGLSKAVPDGDLNYDHRVRGTTVETDRHAALQLTRELRHEFERLDPGLLARPMRVTCKTSYTTPHSQSCSSTVGREMMYSVAHAVHHFALIGVMAGLMGVKLPPGFGVAPSTLNHQTDLSQAA